MAGEGSLGRPPGSDPVFESFNQIGECRSARGNGRAAGKYATAAVTTLAGSATLSGIADGVGSAARFNCPRGPVVDSSGNLFVGDFQNHTIRRITPAGEVTTIAGFPGSPGSTDGVGSSARLAYPTGMALDTTGRLLVVEQDNRLRRVTSNGLVTTIAGGSAGSQDGISFAAQFDLPVDLWVSSVGELFITDSANHTVRKGAPSLYVPAPQVITFDAVANTAYSPAPMALSASASSGLPVGFSIVSGPAQINGSNLTATGAGVVTVRATQPGNLDFLPADPVERVFTISGNFLSWQLDQFDEDDDPMLISPAADFDRDGLSNLLEYALDLSPKVATFGAGPAVSASSTELILTYSRPSSRPDIEYAVEASTDLSGWTTNGVQHNRISTLENTETWKATFQKGNREKAFLKLRVRQR